MIRHLSERDFRLMPWANGKGTTVELLRVEREGRLILRLSRAMVVEDGDFSLFPGIERSLTVLTGPGFDLIGQDLYLEARPLMPIAFAGDIAVRAERLAAPSEDFNVMTARDMPRPRVWLQEPGLAPCGAVLALAPGRIAGVAVARYDLVISDEELPHDMAVIVVQAGGL